MNKGEQMYSDSDDENIPLAKRKWKIKKEHCSADFSPSISFDANAQPDSKVIFIRPVSINCNILNILFW